MSVLSRGDGDPDKAATQDRIQQVLADFNRIPESEVTERSIGLCSGNCNGEIVIRETRTPEIEWESGVRRKTGTHITEVCVCNGCAAEYNIEMLREIRAREAEEERH